MGLAFVLGLFLIVCFTEVDVARKLNTESHMKKKDNIYMIFSIERVVGQRKKGFQNKCISSHVQFIFTSQLFRVLVYPYPHLLPPHYHIVQRSMSTGGL